MRKILLPNVKKIEVCHHHKVEEVKVKEAREKVRVAVVDPEVEREILNLAREAKVAEEAKIERDEVEAIPEVEASLGVKSDRPTSIRNRGLMRVKSQVVFALS